MSGEGASSSANAGVELDEWADVLHSGEENDDENETWESVSEDENPDNPECEHNGRQRWEVRGLPGLWFLSQRSFRESARLKEFPKLPVPMSALNCRVGWECDCQTSDEGIRKILKCMRFDAQGKEMKQALLTDCDWEEPEMGVGSQDCVEIAKKPHSEVGVSQEVGGPSGVELERSGGGKRQCLAGRMGSLLCKTFSGMKCEKKVHKGKQVKEGRGRGRENKWCNMHDMIQARELGLPRSGTFSQSQRRHVLCNKRLPRQPGDMIDEMESRAYIGQFSKDGSMFVAAFQDRRIRIYDVEQNWRVRKNVAARMLRWTITDTALSPDGRHLLYSSITPMIHLVDVGSRYDEVESTANVTDIHDALYTGRSGDDRRHSAFGIWSIAWSADGQEIIAGTNDTQDNICVYNLEERKTTVAVQGHHDDVNAVAFMDDSAQVFVSGSDDHAIKVWDRRTLGSRKQCAGVLVGHTEGVTHIDAKGDGRHLISNSKDQTIKLWDIRKLVSEEEMGRKSPPRLPHFHWDYRWQEYPGTGYDIRHPHDVSLKSYRGHNVLQTLIRAYFSPMHTTGQRYIYTGSHSGKIHMFDVVTGEEVESLDFHTSVVRDCSWHPYDMMLASVSWDGCVVRWDPSVPDNEGESKIIPADGDKLSDF